jgi:hypothetical protein
MKTLQTEKRNLNQDGHCPHFHQRQMIKLELLHDAEIQELTGGNGWAFPSLTSKTSTMEINNLVSQSNVGSAWASSATATGGGGSWHPWFHQMPSGGASTADAKNIQKNYNSISNFGFSFTI